MNLTIDAHQHFWKFDEERDTWMDPKTMNAIRRDFMPEHLQPILHDLGVDYTIAVQADQSETENHFLLELARNHHFIAGVVGWIDLKAANLEEKLASYQQKEKLVGFRHILQSEPDGFMSDPAFTRGVRLLGQHNYTYDILVYAHQLPEVVKWVSQLDEQPLIIDHLAKPAIKDGEINHWQLHMQQLAAFHHVYCKLSGMVTEASWHSWTEDDLYPYLDVVWQYFGPERCIYGSDWPVCTLAAPYRNVWELMEKYFAHLDIRQKSAVMGNNALRFYQLKITS